MTNRARMSRRVFLTHSAVVGAAASLPGLLPTAARAAAPAPGPAADRSRSAGELRRLTSRQERVLTGQVSSNGWEVERIADDHGSIYARPVPGTPLTAVQVRIGEVETVLVHVIRRFHYEIDELYEGDVVGWRSPATVRMRRPESNQASGTAVQIRPGHCPAGTRGNLFPLQVLVIRDILAELDGVVRWGGDDRRVDESLFSIDVAPGDPRLARVVNRIRGWQDDPGRGAGAQIDILSASRRSPAKALERRQRGRDR